MEIFNIYFNTERNLFQKSIIDGISNKDINSIQMNYETKMIEQNFIYYIIGILFFHIFYTISLFIMLGAINHSFISLFLSLLDIISIGIIIFLNLKNRHFLIKIMRKIFYTKTGWLLTHSIFCIFICLLIDNVNIKYIFSKFLYGLIMIITFSYLFLFSNLFIFCACLNILILIIFLLIKLLIKKWLEDYNNIKDKSNYIEIIIVNLEYINYDISTTEYFVVLFLSIFSYFLRKFLEKNRKLFLLNILGNNSLLDWYRNYFYELPGFRLSFENNKIVDINKNFKLFLKNDFISSKMNKNLESFKMKYGKLLFENNEEKGINFQDLDEVTNKKDEKNLKNFLNVLISNKNFEENPKLKEEFPQQKYIKLLVSQFTHELKSSDDENISLKQIIDYIDSLIIKGKDNLFDNMILKNKPNNSIDYIQNINDNSKKNKLNIIPSLNRDNQIYKYSDSIINQYITNTGEIKYFRENQNFQEHNISNEILNSTSKKLLQNKNKLCKKENENILSKLNCNFQKKGEYFMSNGKENFKKIDIIDELSTNKFFNKNNEITKKKKNLNESDIRKRILDIFEKNNKENYEAITGKFLKKLNITNNFETDKKLDNNDKYYIDSHEINLDNKNTKDGDFQLVGEFNLKLNTDNRSYILYYKINKELLELLIIDVSFAKYKKNIEIESKIKHKILSKIAHEFKTPINNILGLINSLKLTNKKNYMNNKELDLIQSLSNYTIYLISDVIQYASNDITQFDKKYSDENNKKSISKSFLKKKNSYLKKNFNINFRNIDIKKCLFFAFDILNALISCHESKKELIQTQLYLDENYTKYIIKTDELKLNQIILNLISNSVKFTKKGKIVIIAYFFEKDSPENILSDDIFDVEKKKFLKSQNLNKECNLKSLTKKNKIFSRSVSQIPSIRNFKKKSFTLNSFQNRDEKINSKKKLIMKDVFLKISIVDTGIGIPEENQKDIFNEKIKLNTEFDFNQKGSGLGLSICLNLLKLLDIKIIFSSKSNLGSIFSLIIPVKYINGRDKIFNNENRDLIAIKLPTYNCKTFKNTFYEENLNKSSKLKNLESLIEEGNNKFNCTMNNLDKKLNNREFKKQKIFKKNSMFNHKLNFKYKEKIFGEEIGNENEEFSEKIERTKKFEKSNFFKKRKFRSSRILKKFSIKNFNINSSILILLEIFFLILKI